MKTHPLTLAYNIKALSIRQPHAFLILANLKDVENRSRRTHFRGRVWVHASAAPAFDGQGMRERMLCNRFELVAERLLIPAIQATGAIIGSVEIYGCVTGHTSPYAWPGLWHWLLRDPEPLPEPVPCKGRLGFWTVPDDVLERIKAV